MKTSIIALTLAAVPLAGCTTLPKPAPYAPVSAGQVLSSVQCQIAAAVAASPARQAPIEGWAGTATLEVTLSDGLLTTPGLGITTVAAPVTFTAKPSASAGSQFSRVATYTRPIQLTTAEACAQQPDAGTDLDFGAWLDRAEQMDAGGPSGATLSSLDYTRTFTVTRTVAGGLSFSVYNVAVSLDANSASRSDIFKLSLHLAKPEKKAADKGTKPKTSVTVTPPPPSSPSDDANRQMQLYQQGL